MEITKQNIIGIEMKAMALMKADNEILNRHNWISGGDVDKLTYLKDLKRILKKLKIKKLEPLYYLILEDANYHTLNEALVDLKMFPTMMPWTSPKADRDFKKYKRLGGRTWEL